jgi:iron(II)-dependent oxidoreductase
MTFRRISPRQYGTNSNDFFLLETEVTNEMYERFLKAAGRSKGDLELAAVERARAAEWKRSRKITVSSASPVYDLGNPALLWSHNAPPPGMGQYPVALITIDDAKAFCHWLTNRYASVGTFRLPTVGEWLIAAYGANRKYPWGDNWSFDIPCVSSSKQEQRTSPEPVKAHPKDRTPEGIYGLWGNVAEWVSDENGFRNETRWMGPSFKCFPIQGMFPFTPRNSWWGYVHNSATRQEGIGFRVLLVPADSHNQSP